MTMHREAISQNYFLDAMAEVAIIYDVYANETDNNVSNFDEKEEVDRQLISFKILMGSGMEIDLTNRLTPEEIKIITENEW